MIDSLDIMHQINEVGQETAISKNKELIFWILMLSNLIIIALVRSLRPGYMKALFSTAIINRQLLQKYQEELKLFSPSSALLTITYFINVGVLISYLVSQAYGQFALILIAVLTGLVTIKWISMWMLSFIAETKNGILEHGLNHLLFFQVGGIILTPIVILSHFFKLELQEIIVPACLIFAVFLVVIREIHSIARSIKARISVLYIILYLCTLELLPLVVTIYAFVNSMIGLN